MKHRIKPPDRTRVGSSIRLLDRIARHLLLAKLGTLRRGQITVDDGTRHVLGSSAGGSLEPVTVSVRDPRCYRRMLFCGTTGAAEAYILGLWDTDDLPGAISTIMANGELYERMDSGFGWLFERVEGILHRLNKNTPHGSLKNIVSHYDLGNDFFSLFLDETMAYSSGIFEHEHSTLREASEAKFDHICRKLRLKPSDTLIEIGTGWGGFAIHAAKHYGCHVTTTTISREQYAYARDRVKQAGLSESVNVIDQDYRDLTGSYDKLVSIEMIEAVGDDFLGIFFRKCSSLLNDRGLMALQAITVSDERYERHKRLGSFINKYIFPGSHLLSARCICDGIAEETDMHLSNIEDITPHYARTLCCWRERFISKLEKVREMAISEEFIRMWIFYLACCEAGFAQRWIGDMQLVFAKPKCEEYTLVLEG
jgi:cyclopropane-fatty-acyl-phospholipid synthase